MATTFQIVFDCADPDGLARYWASALDYKLDDPPDGYSSWQEALADWGVPENEWNSASAIVDPEGKGPRIYFQRVSTPKPEKNRIHLDLNVGGGDVPLNERWPRLEAEVERLLRLGATRLRVAEEHVVMQDPEGNEFCVQ